MRPVVNNSQLWPKDAPLASEPSHNSAEPVMVTQKSSKEFPVTPPRVKFAIATIFPPLSMVEVADWPTLRVLPVICPPKREVEVAWVVVERVMLSKMLAPVQVYEPVKSVWRSSPEHVRPVETTSEQSKIRSFEETARPSPTAYNSLSPWPVFKVAKVGAAVVFTD